MSAIVTVRLKGRTAFFEGPRGVIVKAFQMADAPWMVDWRTRVPCVSVDRADDCMVALENRLRVRVHLVDETAPQLFNADEAS